MFRHLIVSVSLTVALGMAAAMAEAGDEGEASLIEGDGILSLLQGGLHSPAGPSSGPSATILQQGPENRLMADQSSAGLGALLQVQQLGGGNLADIVQSGASNAADLVQQGDDNQARLTQYGNGNILLQMQEGVGLGISVTQYGGSQMIITQRNN